VNNSFLVPANAKRGTLIFNMFRPFDLILFGIGLVVTILLLALFSTSNIILTVVFCIPAAVCTFLVVPIPNYHNILGVIQSVLRFYNTRRKFVWRGWCFYDEFKDDGKSK